jgi:hypothetical protein
MKGQREQERRPRGPVGLRGFLAVIALATTAAGCGTGGVASIPGYRRLADVPGAMIQMRRAGCVSGQCPVYGVAILPDLTVVYDGEAVGARRSAISPDQMRELQLAIEKMHFLDSTDECCLCPSKKGGRFVVLDYSPGLFRKTVVHDEDCSSAPVAMSALEEMIDRATGLAKSASEEIPGANRPVASAHDVVAPESATATTY